MVEAGNHDVSQVPWDILIVLLIVLIGGFVWLARLWGYDLLDPGATGVLFSTIPGQCAVVLMFTLMYLAGRWAKQILTIDL